MAAEKAIPPSSCANLEGSSGTKNMVKPVVATKMPAPIVTGVDQGRVFHFFTTCSRQHLAQEPRRPSRHEEMISKCHRARRLPRADPALRLSSRRTAMRCGRCRRSGNDLPAFQGGPPNCPSADADARTGPTGTVGDTKLRVRLLSTPCRRRSCARTSPTWTRGEPAIVGIPGLVVDPP